MSIGGKMQIKFKFSSTIILIVATLILAACVSKKPPPPTLSKENDLQNFIYEREVMQRQLTVTGSVNQVIPARVFNVRYTLSCLRSADGRAAETRFNEATNIIDEKMPRFVEGSTRSNPFYRIGWPARTNRLIVEQTGCEAIKTDWIQLSEGREEALKWVVENMLLGDLLRYSRGLN